MTRAQAWSEARRRWGKAIVHTKLDKHRSRVFRERRVRYIVGPLKGPLGVGRSWTEAFAWHDAREGKPC